MNGMFQEPSPAPQGGMMAQGGSAGKKPYNGELTYHGITRPVVNGVAEYEGKKFFVSGDGSVVWDEQGQIRGSVDRGGNLVPVSPETLQKLEQSGALQK